jgi:hypothetical protein
MWCLPAKAYIHVNNLADFKSCQKDMCFLLGFSFFKTLEPPYHSPTLSFSPFKSWLAGPTSNHQKTNASTAPTDHCTLKLVDDVSYNNISYPLFPEKCLSIQGNMSAPSLFWWNCEFYLQLLLFLSHFDVKPRLFPICQSMCFLYFGMYRYFNWDMCWMGCMIYDWWSEHGVVEKNHRCCVFL